MPWNCLDAYLSRGRSETEQKRVIYRRIMLSQHISDDRKRPIITYIYNIWYKHAEWMSDNIMYEWMNDCVYDMDFGAPHETIRTLSDLIVLVIWRNSFISLGINEAVFGHGMLVLSGCECEARVWHFRYSLALSWFDLRTNVSSPRCIFSFGRDDDLISKLYLAIRRKGLRYIFPRPYFTKKNHTNKLA